MLVILLVFGTAPGLVLRLLVRLYPKGHVRRRELLAELYAVRYVERPLFVAQLLETTLFEGLAERVRTRNANRLKSGVPRSQPTSNVGYAPPDLARWIDTTNRVLRQSRQTVFVIDDPPVEFSPTWIRGLANHLRRPFFEADGVVTEKAAEHILREIARLHREGNGVVVRLAGDNLDFAYSVRGEAGTGSGAAAFVIVDRSQPGEIRPMFFAVGDHPDHSPGSREHWATNHSASAQSDCVVGEGEPKGEPTQS